MPDFDLVTTVCRARGTHAYEEMTSLGVVNKGHKDVFVCLMRASVLLVHLRVPKNGGAATWNGGRTNGLYFCLSCDPPIFRGLTRGICLHYQLGNVSYKVYGSEDRVGQCLSLT